MGCHGMYCTIMLSVDDLDLCAVCCDITKYSNTGANNEISNDKLSSLDSSIWWVVGTFSSTVEYNKGYFSGI